MDARQAIISFSQSEKVKSGLIWCSQCAQLVDNLRPPEQQGAVRVMQALVAMLSSEVQLARQMTGDAIWLEADKMLNKARVMIDSGICQEAVHHFTQTLSQVNRIGQKAMGELIAQGLMK
jgi:hypothetical protein